MKSSFCTNAFGNDQADQEKAIPYLAELGYDGIELWQQYLCNADLGWVRSIADGHDLEIVQICPYFDFTTSQDTWDPKHPGCRNLYRIRGRARLSLHPHLHRQRGERGRHRRAMGRLRPGPAENLRNGAPRTISSSRWKRTRSFTMAPT